MRTSFCLLAVMAVAVVKINA